MIRSRDVVTAGGNGTASAKGGQPSLAAGASHQTNITVAGAVPGDSVQAGFSVTRTAVAWNRSGSTVDLAAGTIFGQVVKPRLV